MMLDLQKAILLLREWAKRTGCIGELVIFGSHAKGRAKESSDLDLALRVVRPLEGDTDAYTTLISEVDRWQSELTKLLGVQVHLEDLTDETVSQYVQGGSIPVYRETAQTTT